MSADETPSHGGRKHPAAVFLARAARAVVALSLLWWAVASVDWARLQTTLANTRVEWLIAAVALVVLDRALMAWRWLLLLRAAEPDRGPRLAQVMRVFFVSTFAGTFLPGGSIGGDVIRAVHLSRLGVTTASAVGSVAVDRLLGILSVVAMAAVGLALTGRLVDGRLVGIAWLAGALAIVAALACFLLLFDSRVLTRTVNATTRWSATVHRLAHKFLVAVRRYGDHRRVLAVVLAASVAVQVLRTLQAWCLGLALGIGLGAIWYFAWIPIIVLVMLLPISVAGIGTGNAMFMALFDVAGVSAEPAFALSVLFLALGVVGNLPGGLLLLFGPASRPASGNG